MKKFKRQIICPKCQSDNVYLDYPESLGDAWNYEDDNMYTNWRCESCCSEIKVKFEPTLIKIDSDN